jgi:hypothetical protein
MAIKDEQWQLFNQQNERDDPGEHQQNVILLENSAAPLQRR